MADLAIYFKIINEEKKREENNFSVDNTTFY